MKKALLILTILSLIQVKAFSSHILGGEITWACQGNGQYIFTMILYRDCGGPGLPTGTQTMDVFNNPALVSISLPNWTTNDITYCQPTYDCYTGTPPLGATEQGIYTSNPITLSGVPPAGGWVFSWTACCRNTGLDNLVPNGFTFRSVMYPFNGLDANPCFDSSPAFAEKPKAILSSSTPFVYNHGAFDSDMDSLHYEWGLPLDQIVNSPPSPWVQGSNPPLATFNVPYTYNNPFPHNPPSIAATIDPATGEINFTSFTSGNFVANVEVSSYKCGVLVSQIYREFQYVIKSYPQNNNPVIDAPFQDTSGTYTLFADTVWAGDSIFFNLTTYDYDTTGGTQSVTLSAYGSQFGANFTDTASGCLIPPCAVIDVPMPATGSQIVSAQFKWQTTVDHLGMLYPCAYIPNTYYFNFKSTDSHCPAPGVEYKTVSITVLPVYPKPVIQDNGGTLTCLDSNFNYQWYMNRFKIPGATSQNYTPIQPGFYQVRITDNLNSGNYSEGIYASPATGISNTVSGLGSINVHPNPANDLIAVEFTQNVLHAITLSLYDMTGRKIFEKRIPGVLGKIKEEISLRLVNSGLYTFEIRNDLEAVRKKIVVAH